MKKRVDKEYANNLNIITIDLKEPFLYRVMLHNDDFTPMEFVLGILQRFFFMDRHQAMEIMLKIHRIGKASCGVFSKDLAESKISDVIEYARTHEHPLLCSLEIE